MLELQSHDFVEAWGTIGSILGFCLNQKDSSIAFPESGKRDIVARLDRVRQHCTAMSLENLVLHIDRIKDRIGRLTYANLGEYLEELRNRMTDELKHSLLVFIPNDKAKYYRNKLPFGREVVDKWPSLAYDIEEAARCFATDRHTATVFHLMRIMEVGVLAFAKVLKIKLPSQKEWYWGNIIPVINDKLNSMKAKTPRAKDRKRPLQEGAAYLHHVKEVWRNQTMHPKATYTEHEAERVFANVKQFMEFLVTLV
jgi:hypothetical protein